MKTTHYVILSAAKNLSRMRVFKVSRMNLEILRRGLLRMTIILLPLVFPSSAHADVKIGEKFGFGDVTSLGQATTRLVMPIFSLAAVAVIIYFLFGAFKYLVSRGNKEEVEASRQMITHSIIGFIILMFAFLMLQFLLSSLFGITGFQIIGT